MSVHFSRVVTTKPRGNGGAFSVKSVDLHRLGEHASPVMVLDDFRVNGRPFGPHPHAGFSAVTYVFEDSPSGLRSRDSLGNDIVVGPGSIVWTQSGSGVIHEEVPADKRELHGVQFFVNLSAKNKLAGPKVLSLQNDQVREWQSPAGDRVRVVVGTYEGMSSSLEPADPFTLLDVALRKEIAFDLPNSHNAVVYVWEGEVLVLTDRGNEEVLTGQAIALFGDGGRVTFRSGAPARFLLFSGAELREPVTADGPFIMNNKAQIAAAKARYREGAMGYLEPLPKI